MKRPAFLLAGSLVAITMLVYLPAIGGGFIWDDDDYVTENPTLGSISGLKSIWADPSATPQYYPLVHTTFWTEHQIWGLWPGGYHLVNVLIHAFNAILVWRLLLRLSVPGSWLAALVFAVHPVHVESVAWITERKNVLSGLFYLLAVHCFLRYWDFTRQETNHAKLESEHPIDSDRGNRRWYFLAHVCFLAALLSKTVAATLPAALLVLIWWKRGRIQLAHITSLVPMFVMGISLGLLTVWLEKHQVGAIGIDWELSMVDRFLIAGRAIAFYAFKLLWPAELIFTYPRWTIDATAMWQYAFPIGVLVMIFALWFLRHRIGRGPLAAVLFFAGTLFPALGFFDVYPMRFSFVADHFQYLASIGVIALLVAAGTHYVRRMFDESSKIPAVAAGIAVCLLGLLTWQQGKIYEGLEVLWRDTLAKNPSAFMAHNNLGALLNDRGDFAEAEQHLRRSVELKPGFVDSVVNLAKAREGQGDFDEAIQLYHQATEIDPGSAPAFNGLGAVYGMTGRVSLAEENLKKALELNPNYAMAHSNLATLYAGQGRAELAIAAFEKAIELDPQLLAAKSNFARVLMSQQQFDRAEELLKEVLDQNPNDISTLLNLGVIAGNQKRYQTAIGYFERVVRIDPTHIQAHYNLGAMHDMTGNPSRAATYFETYERLRGAAEPAP